MLEAFALGASAVGAAGTAVVAALGARAARRADREAVAARRVARSQTTPTAASINAVLVSSGDKTVTVDLTTKTPEERKQLLEDLIAADRAAHAG